MIKLLHISANTYPPLYGEDHHTKNIWKELAKGFDEYHVLARSETNRYSYSREGNMHLHLIPRITIKSKIFFISSCWMFVIIFKHNITHMLSQCSILGGFLAVMASKVYNIPLMTEVHGEEYFRFFESNNLASKIMRYTFSNSHKIRSLNDEMTRKLTYYGVIDNVVSIPNRVNLEVFNIKKEDFNIIKPVKLISAGRFVWEKDYENLILYLNNSTLDYHLTLVGGGILTDKYKKIIKINKLESRVTLIEWVNQKDLIDLVTNSDIYIQSSVSEGMPRTIVEAMALQMPIVSTNVGSVLGVLKHDYNSIIVNPCEEGELLSAIRSLISNKEVRIKIAKQAYCDVVEKYEWNKVFEIYRSEILTMNYKKGDE